MSAKPAVGVGAIVRFGDELLVVRRRSGDGRQTWSPPGGYLDPGETFEACAKREVLEETGVTTGPMTFVGVTNDVFPESQRHCVTLWMAGEAHAKLARVCAPEEVEEVRWVSPANLPQPLFLCFQNLLAGKGHMPLPEWLSRVAGELAAALRASPRA